MSTSLPQLQCLCASFRRASRALTQLYARELRPLGLQATQFTVLQALSITGEVSQGRLGQILAIDSTTLTRTLTLMRRNRWIAERRGHDRRERWIRLARAGELQLHRALPLWGKVQSRLHAELGDKAWNHLLSTTTNLTAIATNKGDWL